MRQAFVPALAVLVVIVPLVSAEYTTEGVGPDRTGAFSGEGPTWDDVAWSAHVPGSRAYGSPPIVLGGTAYVLTADLSNGSDYDRQRPPTSPALNTNGIFAFDLATGDARLLVKLPDQPVGGWTTDGARFFVAMGMSYQAFAVADGAHVWTWQPPRVPSIEAGPVSDTTVMNSCLYPAYEDGVLYVGCTMGPGISDMVVAAVEAASGQQRWAWRPGAIEEASSTGVVPLADGTYSQTSSFAGLSVLGPYVFPVSVEVASRGGALQDFVWALRATDGTYLWSLNQTEDPQPFVTNAAGGRLSIFSPALVTGTPQVAYVKFENVLEAVNTERGNVLWQKRLGDEDASVAGAGSGTALARDALYATSYQSLVRLDVETQALRWQSLLPRDGEQWASQVPLVDAHDRVFLRSGISDAKNGTQNATIVYAVDAGSGVVLWRHDVPTAKTATSEGPQEAMAIADGLLVLAGVDGNVTALGHADGSIAPHASVPDAYPPIGTLARMDLSGTVAGAAGPASDYRVDWGDGTTTEWRSSPTFEHAYATSGNVTAFAFARNAAGQTARVPVALHPGVAPPASPREPTLLERAFSQENQNTTFFVLGLAITSVGGAIGLLRASRSRRLFRHEMQRIDQESSALDEPHRTAALATIRREVASLAGEGKLTAGQLAALDRRLDEVARARPQERTR